MAGFPIESSTVITFYKDLPYFYYSELPILYDEVQRNRNIAIIVGTVIPGSLSNYRNNFSHYLYYHIHSLQEGNNLSRLKIQK